ncbi:threonine--tRNA ligase [Candidatus Nitrosopelagicus brevis]|uniref:Threonine--tRNA ligase n=2 Tax=Nitrososphaerota TaxID=651137 RepID=A0A0A7V290_9ARCH|nr:threonine--tRNA ligase [Candidatus Nitrosopelagicus brevis]AIF03362.1 threonyl-tRNA synthetase (TARS, thrS) [uncultured marine thaumarchaeote KM3_164_C03]AJA92998.1 threonine--tRNA ligase [Candidatus Nitrosopelagicus brevis]PTL88041.1 threonine--tRNA ligase [Candidatus Nitrosopelagicus brevis]
MRILQLHCDNISYEATKKEIKSAEDIEPKPVSIDEVVVCFVAIENGDNNDVGLDAISQIKESMQKIGCKKLLLYPYAHLSSDLAAPSTALSILKLMESESQDLEVSRAPFGWTKSYNVKVKGHPLAESSKVITAGDKKEKTSTALESESKIKSYWFILSPDGSLTEFDKFNFSKHKKLEKLAKYESDKNRNVDEPPPHVALMKKLAIADYEPASDHGNMRFFPNGRLIKSLLEQYVTNKVKDYGGYEVETPIMYDSHHPSMESYFNRFPARQYNIDADGKQLFLRFAACFGQFLIAHDMQISYKNLPYRLYEMTRYSFRREQSGELVGLRRLRAFTMPDCHAFCKDIPQAIEEFRTRFDLSRDVLKNVGIENDDYEMAIRFTEDFYNENKELITEIVKKLDKPVLVEMWKERFFYFVLKWEFNYIDNLGKASALSTDQIDVENGNRYGIEFVDENNKTINPIILHNSPSGAIERVIYALLEKCAKDAKEGRKPMFPLWLAPTQVRIIPLKDEFMEFSQNLFDKLTEKNIRVDIDDRNESIGKRIRESEKEWIRYVLVIGDKEVNSENLSVRDRTQSDVRDISFDDFINEIQTQNQGKPNSTLNLPPLLSKRPIIQV